MIDGQPAECPGEEALAEFASGSLPPASAESIEAHLDGCPDCAWLAGRLIGEEPRLDQPSAGKDPEVRASDVSRYLLHEVVGSGGMGTVYEAESVHLGRRVALKLLRDGPQRPGARERFLREARITAMLEHPNIVPVLEVGELEDGAPYCALRLVKGGTLALAIAGCKDLKSRLALLPHFRDLCNAIGFAHGRGVIHRDIKPGNVLVGAFGETVVVDWGLARQVGAAAEPTDPSIPVVSKIPGATRHGAAMGTPGYMSPEQAAGLLEQVDERSDVYSLGAVLFELLMGRPPFAGSSEEEILRRVVVEPVPRAEAEGVPPDLAAIAAKALSRNRAHRYANGSAMEVDVAAWMAGRRVAAYQYSAWHLVRRMAVRHRAIVLGLLLTLALGGAWAGSAWGRTREQARQRADELILLSLRYTGMAQWDRAAMYFALAGVLDDRPEGRWGLAAIGTSGLIPLYKVKRHTGPVRAVAFSPDGALFASASDDRTLRIVEVSSGQERARFELPFVPGFIAFTSPDVVAVACGSSLELFDLKKGALAFHASLPGKVRALAVDRPNGRIAVAAASAISLWGRDVQQPPATLALDSPADALAFLPSGALVFGGALQRGLRSWSPPQAPVSLGLESFSVTRLASSGLPMLTATDAAGFAHFLELNQSPPLDVPAELANGCKEVSLTGDGRTLACLGDSGSVRLWDTGSRELFASLAGSFREALSAVFSPDGRMLLVGSADHAVRLWSLGRSRGLVGSRGAGKAPASLAWSPDGTTLVSADRSGLLQLWDGATGQAGRVLDGHHGGARAVAYAPDGTFASAGADGIALWSATGEPLSRPSKEPTVSLAFSPSGTLAAGGADGALRLFKQGQLAATLAFHRGELLAVAFSPDGSRLATGGADGTVLLRDGRGEQILAHVGAHEDEVRTAAFSPDGRWLATGGSDGVVHLWHALDGASAGELDSVQTGEVQKLAFVPQAPHAPAAGMLVGVSLRSSLELWDPARALRLMTLDFSNQSFLSQLAVAPDGRRVALLHADGVVGMIPLSGVETQQSMGRELERLLKVYKYELGPHDFTRDERALRSQADSRDEEPAGAR